MTEEEKRLCNRARVVQDFIMEERARVRGLIQVLNHEPEFLLYCVDNAYQVSEIERARYLFNQTIEDIL
jgi:hypothetical protein